jgi:hypothetical protein
MTDFDTGPEIFSEEEKKRILEIMRDVANGKLTSEAAVIKCEAMIKLIKSRHAGPKCLRCDDTGLVKVKGVKGPVTTFACQCKLNKS